MLFCFLSVTFDVFLTVVRVTEMCLFCQLEKLMRDYRHAICIIML